MVCQKKFFFLIFIFFLYIDFFLKKNIFKNFFADLHRDIFSIKVAVGGIVPSGNCLWEVHSFDRVLEKLISKSPANVQKAWFGGYFYFGRRDFGHQYNCWQFGYSWSLARIAHSWSDISNTRSQLIGYFHRKHTLTADRICFCFTADRIFSPETQKNEKKKYFFHK